MNTLNERIKKLRKDLDLTQQEFANRLGTTRNNIAGYEVGRRSPSEAVISLICKTFNVSETWLRTGKGEMFVPAPTDALDTFIRERNLSASDRILIEKFAALDAGSRQAVVEYVLSVADEILKSSTSAASSSSSVGKDIPVLATSGGSGEQRAEADTSEQDQPEEDFEAQARKQAELYYQQLLSEKEQARQAPFANESGAG